jgi:succinate dehydrogenase flavin-adding protein (antitoxin of CptAB toxin-antitoxin module)
MSGLKNYLDIDFSKDYNQMWKKLINFSNKPELSKGKLKKLVLKNKKLYKFASENGKKYQSKLNELCLKSFNSLLGENKLNFLNFILDAKDKDLYVVIANSSGAVIYKANEKKVKSVSKIIAKKGSDVGYTIYIDNVPTYRVQTNATNGIGISPFCQRVFFVDTKQR